MRLIDADALKRKAQKIATEAWKMKLKSPVETVLNQFIDWIDAQPTIEPDMSDYCDRLWKLAYERGKAERNGQWIPVTERLPEDYVDVIVWFEYFRFGNYNRLYQTWGIGDYSEKYGSWTVNHESGWHKLRVIAWMPLPEPYQEGERK